ncbi:MAG: anaerobic sulfite reductase subunit A [Lachnospiraceae bacterium]|nr:anaerobic sulfite reductase subunit A [Lachnospiraceae bacterium]
MGYILTQEGFDRVLSVLGRTYRLYAPVRKAGEGRFTDDDVIRYDLVTSVGEIEMDQRSDYAFKEILTPLSETLFFFTENEVKTADRDAREAIIFVRSCDLHAVKRLDQIYLDNTFADPFYKEIRDRVHFALLGCSASYEDCFCVDMGTNRAAEGYWFSLDRTEDGAFACDVPETSLADLFAENSTAAQEVEPKYVTENTVHVTIPDNIPADICRNPVWDEYSARCIGCGRCNFACPTCTCYTMQDVFYTDNGKVGERRRVGASCMVDGYTNVAGGGEYRRTKGERMRFKVLHKISDFKKRFGYQMCVGCGRCDRICPEYISFSSCINKVNRAVEEMKAGEVR